jgi:signal transduction histidine kinase
MTQIPEKSKPRWAELSDEMLESVEDGRKQAIEAVRKFVDQISPVLLSSRDARPLSTLP